MKDSQVSYRMLWLCAGALGFACATGPSSPVVYSGERAPSSVSARDVQRLDDPPAQAEVLGRAHVSCNPIALADGVSGELLADIDCSRERLTWALREHAAEVGGDAIARLACSDSGRQRRCAASVVRLPEQAVRSQLPGFAPEQSRRTSESQVTDAWHIEVTFDRTGASGVGRALPADLVHVHDELPLSHAPIGPITVRCEDRCSLASLREAVRITAGRAGATSVAAVQCVREADELTCGGLAGVHKRPAELDPRSY